MRLYSENNNCKLYHGSVLDMLEIIEPNSIDSIITDPPYGLTSITKKFGKENSAPAQFGKDGAFSRLSKGFMGKEWDGTGIEYNIDTWKKCFDVLKSGGYLLAFGGTRTYHRIACAIEDAGFEIRDCIMWLYGSGFPKSMNLGLAIDKKNGIDNRTGNIVKGVGSNNTNSMKNGLTKSQEFARKYEERVAQNEWKGWGTCLKPSYEPIIVARKPFKGSLVDNVLEYSVGGLNIDECRIETSETNRKGGATTDGNLGWKPSTKIYNDGRFPANTILTYDETDFDEICKGFPTDKNGSASRYFYCAKASKKDRDEGLDNFNSKKVNDGRKTPIDNAFQRGEMQRKNTHPTVKPTSLMQYLVRLVSPKGATILDPFMGSGSTGKAVMYENKERESNYNFIGIELTDEYLPIADARIKHVCEQFDDEVDELNVSDNNWGL